MSAMAVYDLYCVLITSGAVQNMARGTSWELSRGAVSEQPRPAILHTPSGFTKMLVDFRSCGHYGGLTRVSKTGE